MILFVCLIFFIAIHSALKLEKNCNFKSAKNIICIFKNGKKINVYTRRESLKLPKCHFKLFFPVQKSIFCHFWNGKKWVFVLLKLHFFPILEHRAIYTTETPHRIYMSFPGKDWAIHYALQEILYQDQEIYNCYTNFLGQPKPSWSVNRIRQNFGVQGISVPLLGVKCMYYA